MKKRHKFFTHIFFIITSLCFILPFLLIIAISISNEDDVLRYGYSLFVRNFSLTAYRYVFRFPKQIIDSYIVTVLYAIGNTAFGTIMCALTGYTLARRDFTWKKFILIPMLITMFFSGGRLSSYIVNTQLFHLQDNPLMFMFWGTWSGFNIIVFRTFFYQVPESLVESARLDGAGEVKTLIHIIVPVAMPVLASMSFLGILSKWNDFSCSLYYMRSPQYFTLQFLLQKILQEADFIRSSMNSGIAGAGGGKLPLETVKFAMCVVASGPMVMLFPFFQRFFVKGMAVGAVKE